MNYNKNITSVLPINNNIQIKIFKDQIIIDNFSKIIDIKDNCIMIDNYKIIGKFLKILSIENGCISINGKIQEILVV